VTAGGVRFVERDGVRLACVEAGDGSPTGRPPVVLVHGMACDHTHLLPQLEHLAPRSRVVAVDLRGHGSSDKPDGTYTTGVFGDDLLAVLDELGVERPVLIGHSLGGSVCLDLAVRRPDVVRSIVLLDSGVRSLDVRRADLQPFYATLGGPDHAERVRAFVAERLFEPIDGPAVLDTVATTMAATPAHVFLAMADGVLAFDSLAAARACTMPALLVLSDRPFVEPEVVASLPPNWRTARVVGAGHFLQLVVPDQVNAMLDRWLDLLQDGALGP
jgi:pimeloyl-ACP methyl ester carboxylesterase